MLRMRLETVKLLLDKVELRNAHHDFLSASFDLFYGLSMNLCRTPLPKEVVDCYRKVSASIPIRLMDQGIRTYLNSGGP